MTTDGKTAEGALSDIRVIELGQLIAGPFCGQLLGDMGAQVIKVEAPDTKNGPAGGDPMRRWGRTDTKLWWEVIARNKQAVSADLRMAKGQDIVRQLCEHADILIENFKPGTLERWNLSPETLMATNPKLIVVRVSGYGQTGPYAARAGFGGIGEAFGGWRHVVGDADRPPARMGISIGDTLAATYGCMGALAALHERKRSGKGQIVDAAIYESVLQVMESLVPEYAVEGHVRERSGSILPGIAPSNVYACRDGDYLIGANGDAIFARLATAMGQAGLSDDPRFATHEARGRNQSELDAIIDDWTRQHTIAEVEALMIEHSVPAGRIYTAADMMDDPHYRAREALIERPHPVHGTVTMANSFPKMSRTPGTVRTPAPQTVGQDNRAVYRDLLGLSDDAIRRLEADGII